MIEGREFTARMDQHNVNADILNVTCTDLQKKKLEEMFPILEKLYQEDLMKHRIK